MYRSQLENGRGLDTLNKAERQHSQTVKWKSSREAKAGEIKECMDKDNTHG